LEHPQDHNLNREEYMARLSGISLAFFIILVFAFVIFFFKGGENILAELPHVPTLEKKTPDLYKASHGSDKTQLHRRHGPNKLLTPRGIQTLNLMGKPPSPSSFPLEPIHWG
jgi:hypothetical protein